MKEIEIIPLAKKKMTRRGIPEAWVEAALTAPDQIVEGTEVDWWRSSGEECAAAKCYFGSFSRRPRISMS